MLDDRFDDQLRDAAREYNQPPETPREEMWARIRAERTGEAEKADSTDRRILPFRPVRSLRSSRPFRYAAGIAALLAIGIGLGRLSVHSSESGEKASWLASEATPQRSNTAYHLATTEHLSQSEAFLTLFRASVGRRSDERLASATARQLLATNRLLLDSPAAVDAKTRVLLQDLELVLAEIAQLSPQPRSRDLQLITEGLEQGGVLSRLRTAVPAGASVTQGAL
ncbi:MAG TPA: hypothetical protein VIM84_01175 [Gemmatimonadales bacterium]